MTSVARGGDAGVVQIAKLLRRHDDLERPRIIGFGQGKAGRRRMVGQADADRGTLEIVRRVLTG